MKIKTPRISIIIPSFNSGDYISSTLDSIEQQDYSNYEVIIVDGQSTDNTPDVVKQYSDRITKYISEPDEGQSDAVNKGLKWATGDFVLWQNADDVFYPNAFSRFFDIYNSDNRYDIYYGDIALLSETGRELWRRYFTDIDPLIANYHGLICNNQAAFIRRDVIEAFGFLDKSYHFSMDREFFLRLYRNGALFKHFDFVVSGFRHQPKSKTETPENAIKWAIEHQRIAKQYHLFNPDSTISNTLEMLGSIDKALRLLIYHPHNFASMLRRKVLSRQSRFSGIDGL